MPKTRRLDSLFTITGGHQLSMARLLPVEDGDPAIAYISRTHRRNGLDGWTGKIPDLEPALAGSITVCLRSRNHALASFVQPFAFYTSFHVAVLSPLEEMTTAEKLWWCKCIEQNRFRFNFGRQANRTLGSLRVPYAVPAAVSALKVPNFTRSNLQAKHLPVSSWPKVGIPELFELLPGKQSVLRSLKAGGTPWVSGSGENNGITGYVDLKPEFPAGCVTVASNGSIGASFYQPDPFTASSDVVVLKPKFELPPLAALYICSVLRHESFRYNYARKWTMPRMQATKVPFPRDRTGSPDPEAVERLLVDSPYAKLIDSTPAQLRPGVA